MKKTPAIIEAPSADRKRPDPKHGKYTLIEFLIIITIRTSSIP